MSKALGFKDRRNVWPWFNTDGYEISAENCIAIMRATRAEADAKNDPSLIVTCEQLRPDIDWAVLREPAKAA